MISNDEIPRSILEELDIYNLGTTNKERSSPLHAGSDFKVESKNPKKQIKKETSKNIKSSEPAEKKVKIEKNHTLQNESISNSEGLM